MFIFTVKDFFHVYICYILSTLALHLICGFNDKQTHTHTRAQSACLRRVTQAPTLETKQIKKKRKPTRALKKTHDYTNISDTLVTSL